MTVKELRTLIDNLDEYIHVPGGIERLKKTVLHLAVSGQLVPQDPSEGTGEELYLQIQAEKTKLIKAGKIKKQKTLPVIDAAEAPQIIPASWKWVRLGEVGSIGTGATPSRDNPQYYGGLIPWVTSSLTSQNTIYGTEEHITDLAIKETNCTVYPEGSLVIAMYGQGKTRGQVSQLGVDAATNQACAVFSNSGDNISVDYVRKCIEISYDSMRLAAAGGAQPNLNVQKIKEIPLPLPAFSEQKRIIAKVETIFALIDELATKYKAEQAERKKLVTVALAGLSRGDSELAFTHLTEIIRTRSDAVELRKTILHLAVSGQLVPQDPNEGTGKELYQQIQAEKAKLVKNGRIGKQKPTHPIAESEIPFDIPQNWKWVRVRDTGYALGQKKPDKDFYYIDVSSIDNKRTEMTNDLPLTSPANAPSRARKLVSDGTVIYSTVRPYLLNTAIIENAEGKELIASTAFAIVHPYAGISSKWILYNFLAPYFVEYVNSKSVGAAYPAINDAAFDKSIIPLPPLTEQTRIVQKTTHLLDLVTQLEQRLEK